MRTWTFASRHGTSLPLYQMTPSRSSNGGARLLTGNVYLAAPAAGERAGRPLGASTTRPRACPTGRPGFRGAGRRRGYHSGVPARNPAAPATRIMSKRYVIVGITAVAALWLYIDRVCFSTLADPIQKDLGLSDAGEGPRPRARSSSPTRCSRSRWARWPTGSARGGARAVDRRVVAGHASTGFARVVRRAGRDPAACSG